MKPAPVLLRRARKQRHRRVGGGLSSGSRSGGSGGLFAPGACVGRLFRGFATARRVTLGVVISWFGFLGHEQSADTASSGGTAPVLEPAFTGLQIDYQPVTLLHILALL